MKGAQMVGLEINATKVSDIDTSRKKIVGEIHKNIFVYFIL